ncbi:MAG: glycosyltransferase family 4 protein [Nanoarchaeota archaeon]
MRIVHIMGYFVPEFGYQEYYLSKEHVKMGHDVHVIASDMLYPFRNIEKMFKDAGLRFTSRKRKKSFSVIDGIKVHWLPHWIEYNDFILCAKVKETLEKIYPDIVFAHESRQGLSCQAAFYKDELGFKLIVDQHDFYHNIPGKIKTLLRNIEYFGFRRFLIDYNFWKADKIIAVTKNTKEFLVKAHKISPKRIALVELGVDTDTYYYKEKEASELRKKLGFVKDEVILIFVGTIFRRKNIELLMDAFNDICNKYKTRLLIVGEGEKDYMDELRAHAKELKAGKKILFNGFARRDDLPVYYSIADIGVWPANNSVSIIEAMACKLPIVMVDWQMPHLVSHHNGFKFAFNDKEKLKFYLEKLIKSRNLREKMGENSFRAAHELYSYSTIAQKFLDVAK